MSGSAVAAQPRCLAIRPAPAPGAVGGDEVIYRKAIPYLGRFTAVETLELQPVTTLRKFAGVLAGSPPECTRFSGAANAARVADALAGGRFDLAVLFNEVSFPMLAPVARAGVPAVLVAQNTHSMVAATDPSPLARMLRPLAVAFERRWYANPAARLVLISRADLAGLRRAGIDRDDVLVSPAGAPPAAPLAADAPVLREAVITGSYGWWRKRRDLKSFAAGGPLGAPIYAVDPLALDILGEEGRPLVETPSPETGGWSWEAGLRFGIVTDAFLGGFKLKSLEYVAKNAVVLSLSDITAEFEGLPHAGEFVRHLGSKAQVAQAIAEMCAQEPRALVARFLAFKAACLERFEWERCLAPLKEAADERLGGRLQAAA